VVEVCPRRLQGERGVYEVNELCPR
jgi:hypothetical protein